MRLPGLATGEARGSRLTLPRDRLAMIAFIGWKVLWLTKPSSWRKSGDDDEDGSYWKRKCGYPWAFRSVFGLASMSPLSIELPQSQTMNVNVHHILPFLNNSYEVLLSHTRYSWCIFWKLSLGNVSQFQVMRWAARSAVSDSQLSRAGGPWPDVTGHLSRAFSSNRTCLYAATSLVSLKTPRTSSNR